MVDAPAAVPGEADTCTESPAPTTGTGPWPAWLPWALIALMIAIRVAALAILLLGTGVADDHSVLGGDVRRYGEYFGGGTPYRDFPVEYPPLTLGLAWMVHRPSLLANIALL